MGKIFGICGNYKVDGKWRRDNVSFKGWFVLNEDNTFVGFCVESFDDDKPQRRRIDYVRKMNARMTRVLVGSLKKRPDGHDYQIVFYMMSNNASISPLRYTIPDLGTEHPEEKGYWEWATCNGFQMHGEARVSIQPYGRDSEIAENYIRKQFKQLRDVNGNKEYVDSVLCS